MPGFLPHVEDADRSKEREASQVCEVHLVDLAQVRLLDRRCVGNECDLVGEDGIADVDQPLVVRGDPFPSDTAR
jgi:hypothetical protein